MVTKMSDSSVALVVHVFCNKRSMDRGIYLSLPMAQLSHDQFWGVLVEKWKFTFENNFQVKQHNFHSSCPIIVNENFVWGPFGEDWGGPPGLSLELPVVGRNCA